MKQTLCALLTATLMSTGISQAQNPVKRYDATYSAGGTYTHLSGATDIGFTGDWHDTVSGSINLPFAFKYQNTTVNTIKIESYGSLFLNGIESEDMGLGHITGINMSYAGKGRGKVLHTTTGTAGNRIFKIEFQNVGRADEETTSHDTLNFQIWLYESDNAIEYRAGYANVHDTVFAQTANEIFEGKEPVLCALMGHPGDSIGVNPDNLFIHGTQYQTDISVFSDTAIGLDDLGINNPIPNLTALEALLYGAYPVNGSVIRFAPINPNSIAKVAFDMASIYPNPSRDGQFQMILKEAPKAGATLTIYDMTGKVVLQQAIHQATATIDLGTQANGHYFGKITNGGRTGSFKLIKE